MRLFFETTLSMFKSVFRPWQLFLSVFVFCLFEFVFHASFLSRTNKQKIARACTLFLSLPALSGVGTGYYCCHGNRCLCYSHKNKLSRPSKKEPPATHISSRAFRKNMSKHQKRYTWEYTVGLLRSYWCS